MDANLRGHDSHGIGLIPHYVQNITNRTMRPNTGLALVRDGGAVMQFDGGFGFGQRVGAEMMDRLIERARELGTVVAALRNVHHLGRIGTYAEMAVAAGLVSIHFVNVTGHPPLVAPYPRAATAGSPPTPSASGCRAPPRHEPFPPRHGRRGSSRWARCGSPSTRARICRPGPSSTRRGQPTTDPKVMFPDDEAERGAILPFGLHKGYCLLFAAELLAGVIGGGGTSNPETHQPRHHLQPHADGGH